MRKIGLLIIFLTQEPDNKLRQNFISAGPRFYQDPIERVKEPLTPNYSESLDDAVSSWRYDDIKKILKEHMTTPSQEESSNFFFQKVRHVSKRSLSKKLPRAFGATDNEVL